MGPMFTCTSLAGLSIGHIDGISISLEQEMIIGRALDSTISAVAKAALRDVALGEEEQLVRVQLFLFIAK
jgi:hypothetical protein